MKTKQKSSLTGKMKGAVIGLSALAMAAAANAATATEDSEIFKDVDPLEYQQLQTVNKTNVVNVNKTNTVTQTLTRGEQGIVTNYVTNTIVQKVPQIVKLIENKTNWMQSKPQIITKTNTVEKIIEKVMKEIQTNIIYKQQDKRFRFHTMNPKDISIMMTPIDHDDEISASDVKDIHTMVYLKLKDSGYDMRPNMLFFHLYKEKPGDIVRELYESEFRNPYMLYMNINKEGGEFTSKLKIDMDLHSIPNKDDADMYKSKSGNIQPRTVQKRARSKLTYEDKLSIANRITEYFGSVRKSASLDEALKYADKNSMFDKWYGLEGAVREETEQEEQTPSRKMDEDDEFVDHPMLNQHFEGDTEEEKDYSQPWER